LLYDSSRPVSLLFVLSAGASFLVQYIHEGSRFESDLPTVRVVFFRTTAAREPVWDWLMKLTQRDRKAVGALWEVRSRIRHGIARVIFTVEDDVMVLLHGFVKKSQKTPLEELGMARQRLSDLRKG
jgi:hypothetical protein